LGLWIDILTLGATRQSPAARQKLALDLPLALRSFVASSRGSREYVGELPQAVTRFRYSLSDASARALLEVLEHEFVDAVVDDVITGVEKSLLLVELCLAQPHASLNELVHSFPWESGLKRSAEWQRKHIADQLRSMIAAGVPLPETVVTALGDEGEPCFAFNEIAFAVAPKRLAWSWSDFKKQQGYGQEFLGIAEAGDEAGVSAEGVDYGTMMVAAVMLQQATAQNRELEIDLHMLGTTLSQELTAVMEELHRCKPGDGYRPVAWHNVFWNLISEYERLWLAIETHEPFHDTDQALAAHIAAHYPEVTSTSRPVIVRRRQKLYAECVQKIQARFLERFADRTHESSDHTDS
jgi:hypothetical protein